MDSPSDTDEAADRRDSELSEDALGMSWHRIDITGTDTCRLVRSADGWRLSGVATYGGRSDEARLTYQVDADPAWQTRRALVRGTVCSRPVSLEVERLASGEWRVDGALAPHLSGMVDLDLGFTPATNLFALRRLALRPGDAADAPAAWLNEEDWSVVRLPQRYERRDAEHYWYEAPAYAGLLTVAHDGFIRHYPGLWRAAT